MDTSSIENTPEPTNREWSLSQERAFLEDLVHKRLTLCLAFFAIAMAGTINTIEVPTLQLLILFAGVVVCGALGEAVARSHEKLHIALRRMNIDTTHPVYWINQFASPRSRFRLVGVFVPRFCTFILFAMLIFSAARIILSSGWTLC